MNFELRRIVTGCDSEGRSVVVVDGPPADSVPGGYLQAIWTADGGPIDRTDGTDRGAGPIVLAPPAGGSKVCWFVVPPRDPAISDGELRRRLAERFAAIGAADAQPDTSRHPAMHQTGTIDYVVLLSGRLTLLLDDDERELEPFDVVVQRGTNHAWINKGTEPALAVAVLIDAAFNEG